MMRSSRRCVLQYLIVFLILVLNLFPVFARAQDSIGIIFGGGFSYYAESVEGYLRENPLPNDGQWSSVVIPECDNARIRAVVEDMVREGTDALLLAGFCPHAAEVTEELLEGQGIDAVIWSESGSGIAPSPGRKLLFEFPALNEAAFSSEFSSKPSHLSGWCGEGFPPYQTNAFGPFVMCLERSGNDVSGEVDAMKAASIASLQVLLSHPDLGGAARIDGGALDVTTRLGQIGVDWQAGRVQLPAKIMLDREHPDIARLLQGMGQTDAEALLRAICPACTATGEICGSSCPQECGTKACTKSGDKYCCGSSGMPAPVYSTAP